MTLLRKAAEERATFLSIDMDGMKTVLMELQKKIARFETSSVAEAGSGVVTQYILPA